MIRVSQIEKSYGKVKVLKGLSLEIEAGEMVSIVGRSGAGKTTLLQIMGTLDLPDKGEVWLKNQNISLLNDKALARFRNENIGFVFQFHQLLPEFTALENVCIPSFIAKKERKATMLEAERLLDYLGLKDRISHKPAELSGGEQQRVAVARALINKPSIVLADEPSGNLDSTSAENLHHLFLNLRKDFGYTFVLVTHNEKLAALSDRIIHMIDGKVES